MGKMEKLHIKQFRDTIDVQFNANILQHLRDEEWLLESLIFGLLQSNGLIPTDDNPVKVKDLYEAFLWYNDKPMMAGFSAVQNSLVRLCNGNQVAIAIGQPGNFGKIITGETPFGFDVTSPDYYLVDKSLSKTEEPEKPSPSPSPTSYPVLKGLGEGNEPSSTDVKTFKSVTISGKVDIANYHQVFTSFINPLLNNNVEVTITVKGKSTSAAPLTENSKQYKITKESASQLGLDFNVEE